MWYNSSICIPSSRAKSDQNVIKNKLYDMNKGIGKKAKKKNKKQPHSPVKRIQKGKGGHKMGYKKTFSRR